MFWSSVGQGLATLANWEVLLGILALGGVNLALLYVVGWMFASTKSMRAKAFAFGVHMLAGPIVQAIAITAFVLLLLPTLLGGDGFTPSDMVFGLLPRAIKYGLLALVVVVSLCFVPVLGWFVAEIAGVATFLQGMLIFRPIARGLLIANLGKDRVSNDVFPSFFSCVGYFIIGLILVWLVLALLSFVGEMIIKKRDPVKHLLAEYRQEPTALQIVVAQFLGPCIGVIPLLMYGKHIAIGVQQIIGAVPA
jgi:hypothetical protein